MRPAAETPTHFAYAVAGQTADEAMAEAAKCAVGALAREHGLGFEEAYVLSSLVAEVRVDQVVNPAKGVRAAIPKRYVSIDSLLEGSRAP